LKGDTNLVIEEYLASTKETACEKCKEPIIQGALAKNYFVCPKCGRYNKIPARARIELITDDGSFKELWNGATTGNPIDFPDYEQKSSKARAVRTRALYAEQRQLMETSAVYMPWSLSS
jgi:acetyl-CoA carboxylase beta subunit